MVFEIYLGDMPTLVGSECKMCLGFSGVPRVLHSYNSDRTVYGQDIAE